MGDPLWKKLFESGLVMLESDVPGALMKFHEASESSGSEPSDLSDSLSEVLLDLFCRSEIKPADMSVCGAMVRSLYFNSEGEVFLLGEMLQRSPAFVETDSCRELFMNLLHSVPESLPTIADPEIFGNVFDGLCALSADCLHSGGMDNKDMSVIGRLILIRDCFTGNWMDLGEDDYFEVVTNLEESEPEEVHELLSDLFMGLREGSDEEFRAILSDFLSWFFRL